MEAFAATEDDDEERNDSTSFFSARCLKDQKRILSLSVFGDGLRTHTQRHRHTWTVLSAYLVDGLVLFQYLLHLLRLHMGSADGDDEHTYTHTQAQTKQTAFSRPPGLSYLSPRD